MSKETVLMMQMHFQYTLRMPLVRILAAALFPNLIMQCSKTYLIVVNVTEKKHYFIANENYTALQWIGALKEARQMTIVYI